MTISTIMTLYDAESWGFTYTIYTLVVAIVASDGNYTTEKP